ASGAGGDGIGVVVSWADKTQVEWGIRRKNLPIRVNNQAGTGQRAWLRSVGGVSEAGDVETASTRGCRTANL
ncbi:MAG: hypothetical protein KC442_08005, partial [Thermomicrobiales bacterium]|nr:hypothetical protein [Thermomicrobiales bacterium]